MTAAAGLGWVSPGLAGASLLAWTYLLLLHGRFWQGGPVLPPVLPPDEPVPPPPPEVNAATPCGVPRPVGPSQPVAAVHSSDGEQVPLLPDVTS